jgi:hypothetical protein
MVEPVVGGMQKAFHPTFAGMVVSGRSSREWPMTEARHGKRSVLLAPSKLVF